MEELYQIIFKSPAISYSYIRIATVALIKEVKRVQELPELIELLDDFASYGFGLGARLQPSIPRIRNYSKEIGFDLERYLLGASKAYFAELTNVIFPLLEGNEGQKTQKICDVVLDIFPKKSVNYFTLTNDVPLKMVRDILRNRAYNEMPILADALEDAGVTDEMILNHCREPYHHGACWVIQKMKDKLIEVAIKNA